MPDAFLRLLGRVARGTHWRASRTLSAKQREFLADTLRGSRPEQPCWADAALRDHAMASMTAQFGDDWNWCAQVVIAIYLINPATREAIDRIIAEHVESRSGRFDPVLYAGRGWNPAEVLQFNGDTDCFWRGYRAYSDTRWSSFEIRRKVATSSDNWRESGYAFSGTRGCVRSLELRHRVSPVQAQDYSAAFILAAGRLVACACPGAEAAELCDAMRRQAPFDGDIGPARVRFRLSNTRQDWTVPLEYEFRLALDHV